LGTLTTNAERLRLCVSFVPLMSGERATVTCGDCEFEESFDRLRDARTAVERHRASTGHDPTWEIGSLAAGVERAGEDAGVCGRPGCTNEDSPLYRSNE
jgi:hypothetical protein